MPGCKAPDILSREVYFWRTLNGVRMRETKQTGVFEAAYPETRRISAPSADSFSSIR